METKQLEIEIKSVDEAEGVIIGHAAVFDIPDLGGDVIDRNAFSKTISERPSVPLRLNHRYPIGRAALGVDEKGLTVNAKLTLGVQRAREAMLLAKDRVIDGMSIGYLTVKADMEGAIRRLKELKVAEVSITDMPMNPAAAISEVKNVDGEMATRIATLERKIEALAGTQQEPPNEPPSAAHEPVDHSWIDKLRLEE